MKRISGLGHWHVALLLMMLTLSAGCLKKNQQPCEASATGTIIFKNLTADTCYLYLNNVQQVNEKLPPDSSWYISNVGAGNYSYEFLQANTTVNPGQWNGTLVITNCDTSIAKAP